MPAWWSANLADFLAREPEQIVGGLATRLVEAHSINRDTQVRACVRRSSFCVAH
jgi:hypothetical protein